MGLKILASPFISSIIPQNIGRRYYMTSFDTKILKVDPDSIHFCDGSAIPTYRDKETYENLKIAAEIIKSTHDAIGFPTETVYGLGASALNDDSVRSIYNAKNRPSDNPLIVHVSSIDQLKRKLLPADYEIPHVYENLIKKLVPGPLTFLLPVFDESKISNLVTAGQDTFAVRIPSNPIARALISISDTPLAAPSANASTRPSPTQASHVYHDLKGRIPLILDGGPCGVGLESTVVDGLSEPPMLLRPGGVSLEKLKEYGGEAWKNVILAKKTAGKTEAVRTPGMKYKHYSPTAKVVLFMNCGNGIDAVSKFIQKHSLEDSKIILLRSKNFAEASTLHSSISIDLSLGASAEEMAHNLFSYLRKADEENADYILVEGIEDADEGLAVMNRLTKASSYILDGNSI